MQNVGVTSSNIIRTSPRLISTANIVSHPLNAHRKGKAMHFSGPRAYAISWAGRYLKLLPEPEAVSIQKSEVLVVHKTRDAAAMFE